MMKTLFSSPLRVYLLLGLLSAIGIWAGTRLPVSLFPNSTQPRFSVTFDYASMSPSEFKRLYGDNIVASLQGLKNDRVDISSVEMNARLNKIGFDITCTWGSDPDTAKRDIEQALNAFTSSMPEEMRRSQEISMHGSESSTFVVTFSSPSRSLEELHAYLDPLLIPRLRRIRDVGNIELFNPRKTEVSIDIRPEALAQLNLTHEDIEVAVESALQSRNAGSITHEIGTVPLRFPRRVSSLEELKRIQIPLQDGHSIPLDRIADIRNDLSRSNQKAFKIDGHSSIALIVNPKPGANLKRMSDEVSESLAELMATLSPEIRSKVILDPSEFIGSAVQNVVREVVVGSLMTAFILFVFIGNLRNVATAAIEIPISIALAFILMRFFDMNLNLVSLAGLALAAGMNVDASVVVMENIFRHFKDAQDPTSKIDRVRIVCEAVREVWASVVSSTLASIVVFLPFAFMKGLSYAVLGDLAKAVIFSHVFSAAVALILVPTVRLHLMQYNPGKDTHRAWADKPLAAILRIYRRLLEHSMSRPFQSLAALSAVLTCLLIFAIFAAQRLPREIIGKPESDFLGLQVVAESFTELRQMEDFMQSFHSDLAKKHQDISSEIAFSFDQLEVHSATVLMKVKDAHKIEDTLKKLESAFQSDQSVKYYPFTWSPSEFQIQESIALRVMVNGGDRKDQMIAVRDLRQMLEGTHILRSIDTTPNFDDQYIFQIRTDQNALSAMSRSDMRWNESSLGELLRTATHGKWLGNLYTNGQEIPITLNFPVNRIRDKADIESIPLRIGDQIIPLKAIAQVQQVPMDDKFYSLNGSEMQIIEATLPQEKEDDAAYYQVLLEAKVREWIRDRLPQLNVPQTVVTLLDGNKDLTDAMINLKVAFFWSVGLILITMIMQFGRVGDSLIVTTAVPLGCIGASISLFIFQSKLSVNAVLGMILLNGIAVNNSIMLVDFTRKLLALGKPYKLAIVEAACQRLRPILITTLTTMLAMLPIACGYGEGGRILQPLGLAVMGGLWFSTTLTLLIVPLLQAVQLSYKKKVHT